MDNSASEAARQVKTKPFLIGKELKRKDLLHTAAERASGLTTKPNPKPESKPRESKIELGEDFFTEIIRCPIPIDLNTLRAMKRSPLGLDLYLWLTYRTFGLKRPLRLTWPLLYRQFGIDPSRACTIGRSRARSSSRHRRRVSHRRNCAL